MKDVIETINKPQCLSCEYNNGIECHYYGKKPLVFLNNIETCLLYKSYDFVPDATSYYDYLQSEIEKLKQKGIARTNKNKEG